VSFEVQPGQRIGIVGATGSGKTTIMNLLLRFYDVSRGRILVDGRDIREWPVPDLRSRFGLVLQDVHVFSGTIASNIRLGDAGISDGAIRRAAEAVRARVHRTRTRLRHCRRRRGATLSVGQAAAVVRAPLAFEPSCCPRREDIQHDIETRR
jgi:ATP-binding cassette subfamily B protein